MQYKMVVIWWQTLPVIERSNVYNIDRLITTTESILQMEQQSWKSYTTSQVANKLAGDKNSKDEEV